MSAGRVPGLICLKMETDVRLRRTTRQAKTSRDGQNLGLYGRPTRMHVQLIVPQSDGWPLASNRRQPRTCNWTAFRSAYERPFATRLPTLASGLNRVDRAESHALPHK